MRGKWTRYITLAVAGALILSILSYRDAMHVEASSDLLQYSIYETQPISVNASYVSDIATSMFMMSSPVVEQVGELYFVNSSYPEYLEVYGTSGSIWYCDFSRMYNESYAPASLPSNLQARLDAENFLTSNGLLPAEAYFAQVGSTTTEIYDAATNTTTTVVNSLDVIFGFTLTLPVDGPGAKIRVSLGDHGDIIGVHWVWREVSVYRSEPAISQSAAIEIFKERFGIQPQTLSTRLVYYSDPEILEQQYLQPYYMFDGEIVVAGENVSFLTQKIPATSFSPMASITAPLDGSSFTAGAMITFTASVANGTAPYTYLWESSSTGVLGTASSFSTTLPIVKRAIALPHAIMLNVTDSNGLVATDVISITVIGRGGVGTPISTLDVVLSLLMTTPALACLLLLVVSVAALVWLKKRRKGLVAVFIATIVMASAFMASPTVYAQPNDDGNSKEVGAETAGDNLAFHAIYSAEGFKNILSLYGWTRKFDWYEYVAWEEDFKYRYGPGGGTDYRWIDAVDFAYYCGHGNPLCIAFTNPNHDSGRFYFEYARWGGTSGGISSEEADLEWIALESCKTLQRWYPSSPSGSVFRRWDQAFKGLHYILGFHTVALATAVLGGQFAYYLTGIHIAFRTIRMAWIRVTQALQPSYIQAAYLRAGSSTANTYWDRLNPWRVSQDPYPWSYLAYCKWHC